MMYGFDVFWILVVGVVFFLLGCLVRFALSCAASAKATEECTDCNHGISDCGLAVCDKAKNKNDGEHE